jgi:hypothetical protein
MGEMTMNGVDKNLEEGGFDQFQGTRYHSPEHSEKKNSFQNNFL